MGDKRNRNDIVAVRYFIFITLFLESRFPEKKVFFKKNYVVTCLLEV